MSEHRGIFLLSICAVAAVSALVAVASASIVTGDNVRIDFRSSILPKSLPRADPAPVSLHVSGNVQPLDSENPVSLTRLTLQVNRHAVFTARGLPVCPSRK